MKKRVLLSLVMLAGMVSSAQAVSIVNSKHDLSGATVRAGSIQANSATSAQTCQFCHTPHNAVVPKLLWNRVNAATISGSSFKVYTSYNSATMKSDLKAASTNNWSLGSDSVSLLCLSCHSLSLVTDLFVNTAGHTTDVTIGNSGAWASGGGSQTGAWGVGARSLSMSHPVGISYGTAQTNVGATSLKLAATVISGGTPLFATNGVTGGDSLECGSCHAVHDPANKPFLRMNNAGSALCLNCHVK